MARNCASSDEVSNRTRTALLDTSVPDSKSISRTRPASSVVTLTPSTAVTVPIAVKVVCHFSLCTVTEDTASGGGVKDFAMAAELLTCSALTPAKPVTIRTTSNKEMAILVFILNKEPFTKGVVCGDRRHATFC